MDDEGWEARMAQRAATRRLLREQEAAPVVDFSVYRRPGDPADILPQILAARCLGIEYGDPGPKLPPETCHECWGDRHVWLGNCWGLQHRGADSFVCDHECHADEVWLAG